jgi:hypothetical protein
VRHDRIEVILQRQDASRHLKVRVDGRLLLLMHDCCKEERRLLVAACRMGWLGAVVVS